MAFNHFSYHSVTRHLNAARGDLLSAFIIYFYSICFCYIIPWAFCVFVCFFLVCLSLPVEIIYTRIYTYGHNYNATIVWFGSQECHYRLSQSFDSLYERDELAINCEETYNDEKTTMNSNNSKHIAIQLEAKQLRRMAAQHTV